MLAYVFLLLVFMIECASEDYYYHSFNLTRSTLSGIEAYRSSLTLDWLAAEDTRQRELAAAYETDATPVNFISTDCTAYPRPAPGKIGRLMLEVLKNLEGDEDTLVSELIQVLIRTKILVETSILESEPDFESLVKTAGMMLGEPHSTFPRIVAVIWMLVTDPATNRKHGWCPINKVNRYLRTSKPHETAKQMRTMDLVMARARFIMEEFIQSITPLNIYIKKTPRNNLKSPQPEEPSTRKNRLHRLAHKKYTKPSSTSESQDPGYELFDGKPAVGTNGCAGYLSSGFYLMSSILLVK